MLGVNIPTPVTEWTDEFLRDMITRNRDVVFTTPAHKAAAVIAKNALVLFEAELERCGLNRRHS